MDVAIDALAVSVLPEDERGSANGFMFAGASIGQAIGGSACSSSRRDAVPSTYLFVVATILAITLFVVAAAAREGETEPRPASAARATSIGELKRFVHKTWIAFTGSRAALVGVLVALLPAGAYALSLALQSNLAVELGLDDNEVAQLNRL